MNTAVTTRNVCHLLNAIAPCACTEFKDAGLEYVCLQLECMLENRYARPFTTFSIRMLTR